MYMYVSLRLLLFFSAVTRDEDGGVEDGLFWILRREYPQGSVNNVDYVSETQKCERLI